MRICVRVKVVRAHAAVIGNKSHKWKYPRKVGNNGLNEFSRVKRERERENCIWWYISFLYHHIIYATKTAAAFRTCYVNYKRTFSSFNCATLLHVLFENGVFALWQCVAMCYLMNVLLIRLTLSFSYHLLLFKFILIGIYFTTEVSRAGVWSNAIYECLINISKHLKLIKV